MQLFSIPSCLRNAGLYQSHRPWRCFLHLHILQEPPPDPCQPREQRRARIQGAQLECDTSQQKKGKRHEARLRMPRPGTRRQERAATEASGGAETASKSKKSVTRQQFCPPVKRYSWYPCSLGSIPGLETEIPHQAAAHRGPHPDPPNTHERHSLSSGCKRALTLFITAGSFRLHSVLLQFCDSGSIGARPRPSSASRGDTSTSAFLPLRLPFSLLWRFYRVPEATA